ncbi:MAG: GtrA family protein [Oscillospiraceae bacterium]|nr:GtrA family protein [Oscillospiraceae bacterium]
MNKVKKMRDIFAWVRRMMKSTLVRFFLVGIINTVFGYAIMFTFYNLLGLNYWISSASNYLFGSILSFFLNSKYTFRSSRNWKTAGRFFINIALCYFVAYGLAQPLTRWMLTAQSEQVIENTAMVVGSLVYVTLNYFSQKYITFRKR